MAKDLIGDLEQYSPGTQIIIYTDDPSFFDGISNVLAFKHRQVGVQHCYHDKRFAIAKGLSLFSAVTFIDVDARLTAPLPVLNWAPGISGYYEDLVTHVSRFTPERLPTIEKLARKIDLDLSEAAWIGESLFTVCTDQNQGEEFCELWGRLARYLELHKIQAGAGNAVGMAAAKLGLSVQTDEVWRSLKQIYNHTDASQRRPKSPWQNFRRRLAYHRRLNLTRFSALKDFEFYYF
ncbi:hypothetical protein [Leptolyngbya sp. PCC 6406]|uniref:hypothetical protein n=1 Tax=Leptolyngbya sp. PCC 6406 TaxID=1173264 RepID=UPI0012DF774D|nr:hypothetical protein [Leptolyngbya sp. PCC 6406]